MSISTIAQNFSDIQEYNQRLLINPSYTGTTFGHRLYSTVYAGHSTQTNSYTKILSGDFYFPKEMTGIGIYGGVRSNGALNTITFLGEGSFSKFYKLNGERFIIPSLSVRLEQSIREIPIIAKDRLFSDYPSAMDQTARGTLKTGLLHSNYDMSIGFSGAISWQMDSISFFPKQEIMFRMIVHWEKAITYYHQGLSSKIYLLQPRLIVDISSERTQLFGDINLQRKKWLGSIALLHNLQNNKSRMALSAGYDFNYFKLNYQLSAQVPSGDNFELIHSFNLKLIIPESNKKGQPIYPLVRDL